MKPKFVITLVIFAAALSGVNPIVAQTTSLAGSWQLTLTPNPKPDVANPVILALATFTADGSVIESDSSQVAPMPISTTARSGRAGTAGHGIWQPAPAAGNLFIQFINLIVNPNGTLYLERKVTISGAIDASGNNFSGNYSFTLTNPIGGFAGGGAGTVTGQRIPHPLLP